MYITHNDQTYPSVRVLTGSGSVRFLGESLSGVTELTGLITVFADNGFEMQRFTPGDFLRQEVNDGSWLLTNTPVPTPQPVVVTPVTYDLAASTAFAVKLLMADQKPATADEIIQCSALWDEWEAGNHTAGEIFAVDGDPWTCIQSYDNAVYPDIVPGNDAWNTFNSPYHGTTRETAREFVQPTAGTTDIYHAGEWCIFEGKAYKSQRDTNFSPKDYPQDWEEEE